MIYVLCILSPSVQLSYSFSLLVFLAKVFKNFYENILSLFSFLFLVSFKKKITDWPVAKLFSYIFFQRNFIVLEFKVYEPFQIDFCLWTVSWCIVPLYIYLLIQATFVENIFLSLISYLGMFTKNKLCSSLYRLYIIPLTYLLVLMSIPHWHIIVALQ